MAHPFLESRDFRSLFLADIVVTVAERYFVLTFSWWLLSGPEASGWKLTVLLALESVPMLAVGILGGPIVDRCNKKWAMLGSVLVQAVVTLAVALLMAADQLTFPLLCAAGVVLGCSIPVFENAANAALPRTVTNHRLAAAAAMQSSTLEYSNIIAASLSAALLASAGVTAAVAVNAVLYVTGAVMLLRLRSGQYVGSPTGGAYADDLKAGLAFLARRPALASFVAVYIVKLAIFVSLLVIIPMMVQSTLGGAVRWVAILEALFSIGAIVSALVASVRIDGGRLYGTYAAALALLGGLMVILAGISTPIYAASVVTAMGACTAWLLASSNILFHRAVPDDMKGRFFGILDTLAAAVTPIGYGVVGVVSGLARVPGVLVANGIALVGLAAVVLLMPRVPIRGALGASVVVLPEGAA